jgi:molybdopterin-dependent oxidoreductase alpha subunit
MCHESSGIALTETLGIGKGSVTLDDFPKADLVMVIGQNPGTNHPRMLSSLEKLKKNGGKIISINPLEEVGLKRFKNPQKINGYFGSGTELTDVYLKVKINQDIPLLKAIMKTLINRNNPNNKIIDEKFIREKTSGFNKFFNNIQKHNLEDLISKSGVKVSEFNKAIKILEPAKKIIICWAMGLTQHKNGVDNIKECVNLLLLKGSIGKKGAGTCPVRGHSNVQGDRSVGIIHKTSPELSNALKKTFNFDSPKNEGYDTVHSIKAMYNRKAKIFVSLGGNF